ncbi:MAG TPA: hypothetical protein VIC35_08240 [Acidimicrobiia bacterium]
MLLLASTLVLSVVGRASAQPAPPSGFVLTAQFQGLYPGADLMMPVTVHNPQGMTLMVNSASAAVSSPDPACSSANVSVQSFAGAQRLAAGSSGMIPMRISMLKNAPDACQGVAFGLAFRAMASADPAPASGSSSGTASNPAAMAFTGSGPLTQILAVAGAALVLLGALLLRRSRVAFEPGA